MYPIQLVTNYCLHHTGVLLDSWKKTFFDNFLDHLKINISNCPAFKLIDQYRFELYCNTDCIQESSMGAGTKMTGKRKTIEDMSRMSSVSRKKGQLLYSLADFYKPSLIIELGTALGISTMYMALGNPKARVITIEGNSQLAKIASNAFSKNGLSNISLINTTFDEYINQLMPDFPERMLVFIDGNHTREATLKYFEVFGKKAGTSSILVFDDINWSGGMMSAWKSIAASSDTEAILDLFHLGIVFQGWGVKKQKLRIW
jgi:predicted O-methyltransferase YrrM